MTAAGTLPGDRRNRRQHGLRGKATALAGAAVAVALLGGCAGSPRDVATVDGTAISRDQLDDSMAGARAIGQQISNDQLLSVLIQGQVVDQVAEKRGITITDAERDKLLNPQILTVPQAQALGYHLADIQIVTKAIGEKQLKKALTKADVEVNPRYGSWDPQQALAVIPGTGSLSRATQGS